MGRAWTSRIPRGDSARRRIARSRPALRHRLTMDRWAMRYWACALTCALVGAALVAHARGDAERAERRWGDSAPLLVTIGEVPVGASLRGRTRQVRWPIGLRPPGALRRLPARARASADLPAGIPLVSGLVDTGPGRLGRGGRTVALDRGDARLPLRRGATVDVWATTDPTLGDGEVDTSRVAEGAIVVGTSADVAVIEVQAEDVAAIARAAATGLVLLVGRR